jgi:hypothetical protein
MIQLISKTKHYRFEPPVEVLSFDIEGHFYTTSSEFDIYADGNTADEAFSMFEAYLEDFVKRG